MLFNLDLRKNETHCWTNVNASERILKIILKYLKNKLPASYRYMDFFQGNIFRRN